MLLKGLNIKFVIAGILLAGFLIADLSVNAQCSICTRTAEQLGEQPAKGMNAGILYLAFAPFALIGVIAYRWWRGNKQKE